MSFRLVETGLVPRNAPVREDRLRLGSAQNEGNVCYQGLIFPDLGGQ